MIYKRKVPSLTRIYLDFASMFGTFFLICDIPSREIFHPL